MNRDKYNEAWARLLAARRLGNLEEIHECAEQLAHEAKALSEEATQSEGVACDHFLKLNGYCVECGYHGIADTV